MLFLCTLMPQQRRWFSCTNAPSIAERRTPGEKMTSLRVFIRLSAETTMLGSSSRVPDQIHARALESTNSRPASDSLGIYYHPANPIKQPIFIHLGNGPRGAVWRII